MKTLTAAILWFYYTVLLVVVTVAFPFILLRAVWKKYVERECQ